MNALISLVRRFGGDQRGVFGIIFAILAVVLVAFSGAVVDFVSLQQTRTRMQVALDAAALALQSRVFDVPLNAADIKAKALALTIERVDDTRVTITMDNPTISVADGSLLLTARMDMPTIFVSLVGVQHMGATVFSQATRKKLALEIAFVLDNSGSMATSMGTYTRIQNLKMAATCATNIIFYDGNVDTSSNCNPISGATVTPNIKMAVVPFTSSVNVGSTNSTKPWIDTIGISPIANDNFDNDDEDATPYSTSVNRLALFTAIGNDSWRGCLETRPHIATSGPNGFLDTDDTPATTSNPSSMYVPFFAPDLPDTLYGLGSMNNYTSDTPPSCDRPSAGGASCTVTEKKTGCNSSMNNGTCVAAANTYAFTGPQNATAGGKYVYNYPPACDCRAWGSYSAWTQISGSGSSRVFTRARTCASGYVPSGLTDREYQERLCKYSGAITYTSSTIGPNSYCISAAVLPLTTTPATVRSAISTMVADGATNIHEGAAWGFRVLSPTAPFTEGAPYDTATSKVMIIMTDGENTAYKNYDLNGSDIYLPYGYPYNSQNASASYGSNINRLGSYSSTDAQLETEMNTRTSQTCENAKAAGIDVYVIGLATNATSNPTMVKTMLTNCASAAEKAYFPTTATELNDVFKTIARQLSQLRLAQ